MWKRYFDKTQEDNSPSVNKRQKYDEPFNSPSAGEQQIDEPFNSHSAGEQQIDEPFNSYSFGKQQMTDESSPENTDERWYNQMPQNVEVQLPQPMELVQSLKSEGEFIFNENVMHYQKRQSFNRDRDFLWVKKILHTGTLADKVSAHNMLIQSSPLHNLHNVETLVNMVNIKGKRECIMAIDALSELFTNELLPRNRRLKQFREQPLTKLDELTSNNRSSKKHLLFLWTFEDRLKAIYAMFIKNLDAVSRDQIEATKEKAVRVMFQLLDNIIEQDMFLIEQLVNKIGDPTPKIGTFACRFLVKYMDHHQNMTTVVMEEVERLLFRTNVSSKTKFYCLCFLTQIVLHREDFEIANRLIKIYFGQFKACVRVGEVNTKFMKVLLTGVSRIYPFSKQKDGVLLEQLETMYRIVHVVDFTIGVQTLMIIFQFLKATNSLSERFYSSLYRKLLDPAISTSTRQTSLLNLIYRCLKCDTSTLRVKAFVKRLLQVALYQAPNLQSGILILVSQLMAVHTGLMEDAFKKRDLFDDGDSDEHYEDVPDEDGVKEEDTKPTVSTNKSNNPSSWIHKPKLKRNYYDPLLRNPLYAGTEYTNMWELLYLKNSFHPSVSSFANQTFNSRVIKYQGEPLLDFTTSRFLDRFVYKNPKKLPEDFKKYNYRRVFGIKTVLSLDTNRIPVNSPAFLQQELTNVPVEDRFIYDYLKNKKPCKTSKAKKEDSDVESVGSVEFDGFLDEIHVEDEGKKSFDFSKEFQSNQQKKSKKGKGGSSDDDEDDFGSLDDDSDFEMDLKNDEEFNDAFDDIEGEVPELDKEEMLNRDFDDDEDLESFMPQQRSVQKSYNTDAFADADEFSALLEDNAGSQMDTTTINALCNKDQADAKQVAWEMQRDQFVRGTDWKTRKGGNQFNRGKHPNPKREQNNKFSKGKSWNRKSEQNNKFSRGKSHNSKREQNNKFSKGKDHQPRNGQQNVSKKRGFWRHKKGEKNNSKEK